MDVTRRLTHGEPDARTIVCTSYRMSRSSQTDEARHCETEAPERLVGRAASQVLRRSSSSVGRRSDSWSREDHLREEGPELALDDLLDDVGRLAGILHLGAVDRSFPCRDVRRHLHPGRILALVGLAAAICIAISLTSVRELLATRLTAGVTPANST